jgi:hypothetical protein
MLIVSFISPGRGLVANLGNLETVSVQVNGVLVATVIVHDEAITFPLLHRE